MLKKYEQRTITGRSVVDDKEVCAFNASINSANPNDINFSSHQINKELYKANRTQCRADEAEFEDYCYTLQEELIAEMEG